MTAERKSDYDLARELRMHADATRRLIVNFDDELLLDPARAQADAALRSLKNQQSILDALAALLSERRMSQPTAASTPTERTPARPTGRISVKTFEPGEDASPASVAVLGSLEPVAAGTNGTSHGTPGSPTDGAVVEGKKAREVVCEFDQRDKAFERGLEKLNSWLTGGKGGLPFQKRDVHAYLNRGANSEAMIARIENELMGREGYSSKLGKLVVDGLEGEVVIYARQGPGSADDNT